MPSSAIPSPSLRDLPSAVRHAVALATLAACTLPALAADGYRATLIADPLTGLGLPGLGWSLGGSTSLNNSGTVVYSGYAGTFGSELRTGIFANSNGATQTIASGLRVGNLQGTEVSWGAINNHGQVIYGFSTAGTSANDATLLWEQGVVSTFVARTPGLTYGPNALSLSGLFSDQRTVAGSSFFQLVVRGQGGSDIAVASTSLFAVNSPAISTNGEWAIGYGSDDFTRLVVSGRGDVTLGEETVASTPRPLSARINNHGLGVFTSYRPGGGPGANLLGVVDANQSQGAAFSVLDANAGFTSFGALNSGLAINNRNEIAFAAAPVGSPFEQRNVYLITTAGGAPRVVLAQGDAVGSDGTTFVDVLPSGLNSFQINDRGQISLYARLQRGNQAFDGILRLDPEAGASAGNPLLPLPGAPVALPPITLPPLPLPVTALPGWNIAVPAPIPGTPRTWIDPDYAIGYLYSTSTGGPNFESILVPAPLPGGDASFSLHFAGRSFALQAGQIFSFTDHVTGGVAQFTLLGIDMAEQIDPQDAQGFVVGFTFTGGDGRAFNVQMNPLVTAVPEPGAAWLLLAGLSALGLRQQRAMGAMRKA